jgi:pyrroloquinoline quinone biosynthesis protein B
LLLNGDLDHTLGLFSLRESAPLVIHCTDAVRRGLVEGNTMFRTLQRFPGQTTFRRLALEEPVELAGRDGRPTGVTVVPVPLPGKVPKHLEGITPPSPEDNIGLWIRERGRAGERLVVIATAAGGAGDLAARADGADACFFDGTFWSSDELASVGLDGARTEDMAHLPISGPSGSLALLGDLRARRRIYTHINNTNPILDPASPERRAVLAAGWEIAEDGLEIHP